MTRAHVSLVVPTRNRCQAVTRLLDRLASQAGGGAPFEVIVVDDGSTDGTAARLTATSRPFPLHVVQQANAGAAVARNAGARAAAGDILLFLDDDVVPEDGLVAAHARAHEERSDLVAIGDLPPVVDDTRFLGVMLRYWWGAMQESIHRPGHRYMFTDLLSGHCSMRRTQFERLGGFDQRLRCREDYELGYRVIAAGLQLRFVPDAVAWHHDGVDLAKVMRRKLDEGLADVLLARSHPRLAVSLPLWYPVGEGRMAQQLVRLAWHHPRLGDAAARSLTAMLRPLEALSMRGKWQGLLMALLTYWYWRGVSRAAGSWQRFQALLATVPPPAPAMVLDLGDGLETAAARLDASAPAAVRLVHRETLVGDVPDMPGAEPLGARHLLPLLATKFRRAYLRALSAAGEIPPALAAAARAEVSMAGGDAPRDRHQAA